MAAFPAELSALEADAVLAPAALKDAHASIASLAKVAMMEAKASTQKLSFVV